MKRTIFVAVIVVLAVGALGYTIRRVFFNQSVVTTGYLQPEAVTQLNFATTAPITEITVQVGDVVRAGDVLAKQDTSALEATLAARRAALAADQVALQYQQDPFAPQDLQAAQLANAAAQAQLDAAQAKASETVGVQDSLVTRAANDVQAARDTLAADEQQAALNADACSTVLGAGATGNPSASAVGSADTVPITLPPVTAAAPSAALMNSCNQLARQITQDRARVTAAEGDYDQAVAKLQLSAGTVGPTLTQAQRQLELALGREPVGTLSATPANLASAEAAVAKDAVDIEQARVALDAAVLVAPTDGVVSSVGGSLGEVAGAEGVRVFGTPQPLPQKDSSGINLFPQAPRGSSQQSSQFNSLITLGSLAVEVLAQVSEDDLNAISTEARATITFPAIPGESFIGYVRRVEPQAVNIDGHVYFLVEMSLPRQPRAVFGAPSGSAGDGATPSTPLVGLTANVRF